MRPTRLDALYLLMDGAEALSRVEHQGICIDLDYCVTQQERLRGEIEQHREQMETFDEVKEWRKLYGAKFKLDSNEQLAELLYNVMGYETSRRTKGDKPSVDEDSLRELDLPMVQTLLEMRKKQKVVNTYLGNIIEEAPSGLLHPMFSLHTVRTYRSSSELPNFQNIPVRDPVMGEVVRRAFRARPGNHLVEVDYGGQEVRTSACYHLDPTMASYLKSGYDMLKEMGKECYALDRIDDVTKMTRYSAKNRFVFPVFYGSYFVDTSRNLWKAIHELKLETTGGVPLRKHLASKGIKTAKQFEKHIEKVERSFWDVRFPVYAQWKRDWYRDYLRKGYFDTLTGFRCEGSYRRNEVINYPVQGSAFHCLLWSLSRMVLDALPAHRMQTRVVGQIHDSMLLDAPPEELDDVLQLVKRVMVEKLPEAWDWLCVPLEVEAEVCPINGSWHDKKGVEI